MDKNTSFKRTIKSLRFIFKTFTNSSLFTFDAKRCVLTRNWTKMTDSYPRIDSDRDHLINNGQSRSRCGGHPRLAIFLIALCLIILGNLYLVFSFKKWTLLYKNKSIILFLKFEINLRCYWKSVQLKNSNEFGLNPQSGSLTIIKCV